MANNLIIYNLLHLDEEGFILIYAIGIVLICGGIFDIKIFLKILTLWKPSVFSIYGKYKNIVHRCVAILLGVIFILIPITT